MDLSFEVAHAQAYTSSPQRIKNLSENWFGRHAYCPNCGQFSIRRYANNRPVADFSCGTCGEDYELKSQARIFGRSVVDGAYRTMIERLQSSTNPNLCLLHYDPRSLTVRNLTVVPKHFFVPQIIQERRPLALSTRRAGWVGCYISLHGIPHAGRISIVRDGIVEDRGSVCANWQRTLFLRGQKDPGATRWLLSVMQCIEKLGTRQFTIQDIYRFEDDLRMSFPGNRHIREKLRQQLQILRDKGYLEFVARGVYRLPALTSPVQST
jgi:type II restriction enzyme